MVDTGQDKKLLHSWLTMAAVSLAISVVLVTLRVVARRVVKKVPWGWDDYLIFPSLLCFAVFCAEIIYTQHHALAMADIGASTLVQHATNAHRDRDTVYHTEQMLAGDYALHFTYILAFTFPKLSIACLLLRIFNQHRIRVVLFAVIGWIIGTGIAFLIPWVLVCNPPVRHWKPDTKDGYCLNIDAMNVAVNPPNIVSDLVMLLVPLPVLWELKASVGFRLQTFLTMLTGSVGLVASVVRWGYFLKYEILSSPLDIQLKLEIWSTVEPLAYLAAACLPPMRVLFRPRAASRSSSMQRFSSRFEWSRRFHDKLQSSSVVVEDEERTITGERELDNISRSSPDYLHARHA